MQRLEKWAGGKGDEEINRRRREHAKLVEKAVKFWPNGEAGTAHVRGLFTHLRRRKGRRVWGSCRRGRRKGEG